MSALASGDVYESQFRLRHASGEYRWIWAQASAVRNEAGEAIRWYGTCTDISSRVAAERAFAETLSFNQSILDSSPDCIKLIDLSGKILFVNRLGPQALGLGNTDLTGLCWFDFLDTAVAEDARAAVAQAHAGAPAKFTCMQPTAQGEEKWWDIVVTRLAGAPSASERLLVVARDISEQKKAEHFQRAAAERWRSTLDAMPQMVWSMAGDGRAPDYYNDRWYQFTGLPSGSTGGPEWQDVFHPDDRLATLRRWRQSRDSGQTYEAQYRVRDRHGAYRWVLSKGQPELDAEGEVVRWYGTCTDIHERILHKKRLEQSEKLNRGIVEASPDSVSLVDLDGIVVMVNRATLDCYGLEDDSSLVGQPWGCRLPKADRVRMKGPFEQARQGFVGRETVRTTSFSGDLNWWDIVVAPVRNDAGELIRFVVISRDITLQKVSEDQARWAATHDPLTALPNRTLLSQFLDAEIEHARAQESSFALLLLDVDHFKQINDTLGHDFGDAVLVSLAARLRESLRPEDFIARLAGDEFAVILKNVESEEEVGTIIDKVIKSVSQPVVSKGRIMDAGVSIGASLYPIAGSTRAELLKNADVALYCAKGAGRGTWRPFQPEMRHDMQRRASMLSLAKQALAHNWLVPHYQPKIELATGRLSGFEALLRWNHPRKGIQMPDTVAAAFEDSKLARRITEEMFSQVLNDIRTWLDRGVEFDHVAINATASDFRPGNFAERVLEKLAAASIAPSRLQLEVTETVFLGRGAECVERALATLSAAGVKIALDDFGTGYASLAHLKQFPVDIIKIDRSFIHDLEANPDDGAIVEAVIGLGRSLDIAVVAEGIETAEQMKRLLALGCRYGQGYLFGKAMPAAQACSPRLTSRCGRLAAA
jgi:diguanylate cyclase (GGDEF)-like protein/PAS domain S-box-containing protein